MRGTSISNPRGSGYCGAGLHPKPQTIDQFRVRFPALDETTLRVRHGYYLQDWKRWHKQEDQ